MRAGSKKSETEKFYSDIIETLKCNLLKELIVLREDFGFGEERLMRFIRGVSERTDKFDDMIAEGTLDYHTSEEQKRYADEIRRLVDHMAREIVPIEVVNSISGRTTAGEARAKYARNDRRRQGNFSISENEKAVEKMRRMQEYLKENAG